MKTPFEDLPLNTKRSYVMATSRCGCEIYKPVDSSDDIHLLAEKNRLQAWLDVETGLPPLQVA